MSGNFQLSDDDVTLFTRIDAAQTEGIPARFLAPHENIDKGLSVPWIAKRPANDWSAVQTRATWNEQQTVLPRDLCHMALLHITRELEVCRVKEKSNKSVPGRFEVVGVENILSVASLSKYKAVAEDGCLPAFGFHSSDAESIDNIARVGLLAANNINTESGVPIPQSHGAAYGTGVYSTPSLVRTKWYAGNEDETAVLQTIVCLVKFGKVCHLKYPCSFCELDFESHEDRQKHFRKQCRYSQTPGTVTTSIRSRKFTEFDSLISPDQQEWIFRNQANSRVLPVALVRYRWTNSPTNPARLLTWANPQQGQEHRDLDTSSDGFFPVAAIARGTKIEKLLWLLSLKPPKHPTRSKPEETTHLTILLERGLVKNEVDQALSQFCSSFAPKTCNVVTFGRECEGSTSMYSSIGFRRHVSPNFFTSNLFKELLSGGLVGPLHNDAGSDMGNGDADASLSAACLKAVEECVHEKESSDEAQWLDDVCKAEAEMYSAPVPTFSPTQPIGNFARNFVNACAERVLQIENGLRKEVNRQLLKRKDESVTRKRFVFVMIVSKANANVNENDAEHARLNLRRCEKYIQGSGLQTYSKLVKIGTISSIAEVHEALTASAALHSVVSYERKLVYCAEQIDHLAVVLNEVREDFFAANPHHSLRLVMPCQCPLGDGFVVNADSAPVRSIALGSSGEDNDVLTVLFVTQYGCPPPNTLIFQDCNTVDMPLIKLKPSPVRVLNAFRALGLSARAAAACGRSVQEFLRLADSIVQEIALEQENDRIPPEFFSLRSSTSGLLAWMKQRKALVQALQLLRENLNDIQAATSLFSSNAAAFCEWIVRPLDWKFGKKAMKRSVIPLGVGVLNEQELVAQARQEFQVDPTISPLTWTIMELLYTIPFPKQLCEGIRCKVAKNDNSVIDPFLVKVEFVSSELIESTNQFMCELDAGYVRKDSSWLVRVPDAVLVKKAERQNGNALAAAGAYLPEYRSLQRTVLFRAFNAIMLTRNPCIQIPDQYLALLFASFVRACEQLLRWRESKKLFPQHNVSLPEYTEEIVVPFIRTARKLYETLVELCSDHATNKRVQHILNGLSLKDERDFATWLPRTETTGVSSVAEAVAVFCCNARFKSSLSEQKSLIPVALIAEAVYRQTRVMVRKRGDVARMMLRKALGITIESCPIIGATEAGKLEVSDSFDVRSGYPFTVEFFSRPSTTNCSVWGVVASLSISDMLKDGLADCDIFQRLTCTDEVSMRSFVKRYLPNAPPKLLQMALFAQGVAWYKSSERALHAGAIVEGLQNPKSMLHKLARQERMDVHSNRLVEARAQIRAGQLQASAALKRQLKLEEQASFLAIHSHAPRVFRPGEVQILNRSRPVDDQLELDLGSGLLRHHCCMEACPLFLKNLQTERDKWTNKRRGLFRHLALLFDPNREYLSAFHTLTKSYIVDETRNRLKRTKGEYIKYMVEYQWSLPKTKRYTTQEHLERVLAEAYESWQKALKPQ